MKKEQEKKLIKIKEASPYLKIMHELKEEFTEIFDMSNSLGEGTLKLIDWQQRSSSFFQKNCENY